MSNRLDSEPGNGTAYAQAGVNYADLDPFKVESQRAAKETAHNILVNFPDFEEVQESRGESVYLVETPWGYIAQVEEGLGTKNLVADAMEVMTGNFFYDKIAQDTVAMIVNDMITLGAMPLSVAIHVAVASGDWFKDEKRREALIHGWQNACNKAGCSWGGGETPSLKGIIVPGTALLSGSAMGFMPKEHRLRSENIREGDAIIILESSGIHANGLSIARKIADHLPEGYRTEMSNEHTYGETLLEPTHIYVKFMRECLKKGLHVRYGVNVTGHGWRKLMRAVEPWTYVIDIIPDEQEIFGFIQKHIKDVPDMAPMDDKAMYETFNMGAGFAVYAPRKHAADIVTVASKCGFRAYVAGIVVAGPKQVVIRQKNITFGENTMAVR